MPFSINAFSVISVFVHGVSDYTELLFRMSLYLLCLPHLNNLMLKKKQKQKLTNPNSRNLCPLKRTALKRKWTVMFSFHGSSFSRFKPVIVEYSQGESVYLMIRALVIRDLTDSISVTYGIVPERDIFSRDCNFFVCIEFCE